MKAFQYHVIYNSSIDKVSRGLFHQYFWQKANGEKRKVTSKLEKKSELCAQKIFKAFLAYGNQQKAAFCHSHKKAEHKYVDKIEV